MKHLSLHAAALFLLAGVAHAQQAPTAIEKVPLPTAPLLKQAPAFAAWSIRFDLPKEAATAQKPPRRPKQVDVTKTKDIRREVTSWTDGAVSEDWKYGALIINKDPVGKFVNVWDPVKAGKGGSNMTKSDFIDLSWISAKDFVGKVNLPDHVCYYFKHVSVAKPAPAAGAEEPMADDATPTDFGDGAEAWIDIDTRLPVVVKDVLGTRHYQFANGPDTMLTLPADMQKEMDRYLAALRETARYLPPPHRG